MKDKSILEMYLEDMKEIKPLEESELDTLKKALLSGDNSAKNRIIEGHMMYATELIQPFVGCGQEITDLISESHLGDLKAQIRTAVEKRLNEIIDEETKVKNASNMLAERLNDLMEASRILAQEYGREASVEELSDRLMVPKDEVEELLKISLNAMDPEKNI